MTSNGQNSDFFRVPFLERKTLSALSTCWGCVTLVIVVIPSVDASGIKYK